MIVTTAERAAALAQPPVHVLGWAQAHPGHYLRRNPDFGLVTGAASAGPAALAMAGSALADVDVLELYDCYTFTVLVTLEDYGFCAKGEGGPFAASGVLGPGGKLRLNTGGGQLSGYYMWGMTPLSEGVIQARGQGGEPAGSRARHRAGIGERRRARPPLDAGARQRGGGMSVGPVQRDDATAEFFDGAAAGRFLLRQCSQGHLQRAVRDCLHDVRPRRAAVGPGGRRRDAGELGGQLQPGSTRRAPRRGPSWSSASLTRVRGGGRSSPAPTPMTPRPGWRPGSGCGLNSACRTAGPAPSTSPCRYSCWPDQPASAAGRGQRPRSRLPTAARPPRRRRAA